MVLEGGGERDKREEETEDKKQRREAVRNLTFKSLTPSSAHPNPTQGSSSGYTHVLK